MAYDEDLSQNRFFVGLQEECPQLYETASSNRFMVGKIRKYNSLCKIFVAR